MYTLLQKLCPLHKLQEVDYTYPDHVHVYKLFTFVIHLGSLNYVLCALQVENHSAKVKIVSEFDIWHCAKYFHRLPNVMKLVPLVQSKEELLHHTASVKHTMSISYTTDILGEPE